MNKKILSIFLALKIKGRFEKCTSTIDGDYYYYFQPCKIYKKNVYLFYENKKTGNLYYISFMINFNSSDLKLLYKNKKYESN